MSIGLIETKQAQFPNQQQDNNIHRANCHTTAGGDMLFKHCVQKIWTNIHKAQVVGLPGFNKEAREQLRNCFNFDSQLEKSTDSFTHRT